MAHCPVSNMKLSSGVAHIPEMLQRGIHVGLAVDGSASQDGSDLLEEIRICYLLHRLHSSAAAPSGYDVLKLATRGSASLLGRDDIGCLADVYKRQRSYTAKAGILCVFPASLWHYRAERYHFLNEFVKKQKLFSSNFQNALATSANP